MSGARVSAQRVLSLELSRRPSWMTYLYVSLPRSWLLQARNSKYITSYLPPLIASAEAFLADDAREAQRLDEERQAAEKARREAKEREQQEALLLDAVEERRRSERLSVVSLVSALGNSQDLRARSRKEGPFVFFRTCVCLCISLSSHAVSSTNRRTFLTLCPKGTQSLPRARYMGFDASQRGFCRRGDLQVC